MQEINQLPTAAAHFQTALKLNPDNIVAQINVDCNQRLQAGTKSAVQLSKSVEDAFGKYRNWEQILGENGPFDEPNFCFEQGRLYFGSKLYRQAAQQFDRARHLAPDHTSARLWLAQLYVMATKPDEALKLVEEIYAQPDKLVVPKTNLTDLLMVETSAYLAKNDDQNAEAAVQRILDKYPNDEHLLLVASQVFMNNGRYTNALVRINQQLKLNPDAPYVLVNKGYVCLQLKEFDQAIPPLTKALALETNNYSALLNRAIAYLGAKKLDEAQKDYETLQKAFPTAYQVYYGLGEVAFLKQDTNAAIRNYQLYMTHSTTASAESALVTERLKAMTGGAK
jgi:Flp pilus assembly protein TadD